MDLTIGIPVYNGEEELKLCLESIYKCKGEVEFKVIVVDDASCDRTVEVVQKYYPQVKLLVNSKNKGLAYTINRALKRAKGKYFLRLDADTKVYPGTLYKLVEFLDAYPRIGVVGPKLIFPDGRFQASTFTSWPTPWEVFKDYAFVLRKPLRRLEKPQLRTQRVTHVLGAAMMVRKKTIDQIGLLDAELGSFRDETDWQLRMHKAGWEIWYYPKAVVEHIGGHSSKGEYIFAKERNLKSLWLFNRKHFPGRWNQFKFLIAIIAGSLTSFIAGLGLYIPSRPFRRLRIIVDRIIGSFGFVLYWHIKRITNY